ncbi:DeoR/GlpR family DNA-binding transcription regulator [Thorsellia kenyensis]|uniref:DeoR/GlpR family DNA-binding transcription regulator n=1 Tax=Thorsellia kenyensis TaxID=1549888 RepID=A0ABV6CB41_9GAMM
MNHIQRRKFILEKLMQEHSVEVKDLASLTHTSEVTIRSDLKLLESQGKLVRFFGGAHKLEHNTVEDLTVAITDNEQSLNSRYSINKDAKLRIAEYAASLVAFGSTIILDCGSTTHLIAEELSKRGGITVITNNLQAAVSLSKAPDTNLILTGGLYRAKTSSFHGKIAEESIKHITADIMFIGADSFDPKYGVTTFNEGFNVSRVMMKNTKKVIVVADSTKFSRTAYNQVISPEEIDLLITDTDTSASIARELSKAKVEVKMV